VPSVRSTTERRSPYGMGVTAAAGPEPRNLVSAEPLGPATFRISARRMLRSPRRGAR
jgi:hypothetical protein